MASVRRNIAGDRLVTVDVGPGGRFSARGYTLLLLMQRAYGVMDWNVFSGPGWIRTDPRDVSAKAGAAGDLTEEQLRPMLQRLLAQRFRLQLRESTKEMPGYALVVAKGGHKLKPSADGEEHRDTFRLNTAGLSGQGISMPDFARFVAGKLGLVASTAQDCKGRMTSTRTGPWRRILCQAPTARRVALGGVRGLGTSVGPADDESKDPGPDARNRQGRKGACDGQLSHSAPSVKRTSDFAHTDSNSRRACS